MAYLKSQYIEIPSYLWTKWKGQEPKGTYPCKVSSIQKNYKAHSQSLVSYMCIGISTQKLILYQRYPSQGFKGFFISKLSNGRLRKPSIPRPSHFSLGTFQIVTLCFLSVFLDGTQLFLFIKVNVIFILHLFSRLLDNWVLLCLAQERGFLFMS